MASQSALLGGGVQVAVAAVQARASSIRAARLLFADHWNGRGAVRRVVEHEDWWDDDAAPSFDDWHRYREALAGAMYGPDSRPSAGPSTGSLGSDAARRHGAAASTVRDEARDALTQFDEVGGALLVNGYTGRELRAMRREMDNERDPG